ncbi:carbohydrate ABC transporter permease [bacterium]|nr:carbohydrate ABC transporter permease [bacterium]MDY3021060.1 carbohydrate ABC transporter permease [Oliverpabstia sp.]
MKENKFKWGHLIVYLILIMGIVVTILPFAWMVLTSLKGQTEAIRVPPVIFPEVLRFENYSKVFEKIPFARMYLNTIINASVVVVMQLLLCSMAAYAFGRIKFPGRNVIFGILLAVLMVPSSFFILPQYLIIQKMGLLNTIPALFIPNLFSAFGTFLLRQFFMALPDEIEDAARLDGCNHFMIYSRIMLPLIRSGLVALGILTLRFAWNDLMWPLIVNTSTEKMTLSAGLSFMQGQYATDYPTMMAGAVMAVLPLLILFAIFQKQFIEGVAMSGIKG